MEKVVTDLFFGDSEKERALNPIATLIVDDHAIWREAVKSLLLDSEFTVIGEAATGTEGMELAARVRPRLVLLDIRLPDGSGLDFLPKLLERDPTVRVVILSSYDAPVFKERALARGAVGYVVKGNGQEELLAVLRAACV